MGQQADLIAKYNLYRKKNKELNNKLIQSCLDRETILKAAELLGMVENGKIMLEDVQESDVLMDFALNDCLKDGKTAVERYANKVGGADEIEQEILEGLRSSYTSLFKEAAVSRENRTVDLDDVLGNRGRIQIIDNGLSMSYSWNTLLFLRIVPLKSFSMTSGIFFAFDQKTENRMLRAYENFYQRIPADTEDIRRFAAFFKTNRIFGKQGMFI
ncbi:hypothetical protein [Methanocella arvoryzae]|uniref:Uncharacterized protein n=1 Tax=Methanocella arvoryzae (strain DSM 22066 / NBRC 105507 / MRE50) TaxID=351160 RepID=Q0W4L7_METAR|nr:hypothetical protein [Methanocella arvoryzae]CAJ36676.1 hypothetical protein RCIX1406 [Methanocella arvoryzae MRE50]